MKPANDEWANEHVQAAFDFAFFLKNELKKMLFNKDASTFNVIVCCKAHMHDNYLRLMQLEETLSESSLNEVLQASSVKITSKLPNVFPDDMQISRGTYSMTLPGNIYFNYSALHNDFINALSSICNADGSTEDHPYLIGVILSDDFICERCKRYTSEKYGEPCERCLEVLSTGWD